MTKIKEILEKMVCTECLNSDARDFVLYFDFDPLSRTTVAYISCIICGEVYEYGQLIKNKETQKYEIIQ